MAHIRRKFNGQYYNRTRAEYTKKEATDKAKGMRSVGYKARVVFEDGYYRLYWIGYTG